VSSAVDMASANAHPSFANYLPRSESYELNDFTDSYDRSSIDEGRRSMSDRRQSFDDRRSFDDARRSFESVRPSYDGGDARRSSETFSDIDQSVSGRPSLNLPNTTDIAHKLYVSTQHNQHAQLISTNQCQSINQSVPINANQSTNQCQSTN
jgi:hypothetical protein